MHFKQLSFTALRPLFVFVGMSLGLIDLGLKLAPEGLRLEVSDLHRSLLNSL